ncbi:MAG: hypothetical protein AAF960_14755 [Bacteroidota bacterium]
MEKIEQLKSHFQLIDKGLEVGTKGKWGMMNAQNMVEHLSLIMVASTGKFGKAFKGDEAIAAKKKAIFFSRKYPFPKAAVMPGMKSGQAPPPLRASTMEESKAMLRKAVDQFVKHCSEHPDDQVGHLYFGMLNMDEWTHFHVRHFEHHLMQFGLLDEPLTPEMEADLQAIAKKLDVVYEKVTDDCQGKWGMMNAQEMVEHLGMVFVYCTGKFGIPFKGDEVKATAMWEPFLEQPNPWRTVFPQINFTKAPPKLRNETMDRSKRALKKSYYKYIDYCKENPNKKTPHAFLGNISTKQWLKLHLKHIDYHLSQFGIIPELS